MTITRLFFSGRAAGFAALAILGATATASAASITHLDYKLEISPTLKVVSGQVCGENVKPEQFRLTGPALWMTNRPENLLRGATRPCLNYQVQLNPQEDRARFSRYFRQAAGQRITLTTVNDLLPCPIENHEKRKTVSFSLPPQISVSMPGQALAENSFSLVSRPCDWTSGVLIGEVTNKLLGRGKTKINVVMPSTLSLHNQEKLIQWLNSGLDALKKAHGAIPVQDIQLLIFPTGPNEETVPWGQVMRGGGDSVHLYVDETKTLAELNADWVLVHELSHLLHPYLVSEDSWLAEGIASYYQNVLRARNGLLDQQIAWKKLLAGFHRGEKQFSQNANLKDDTRRLMQERKYMRVYWSGAAIALLADVQLRLESGGQRSLDTVLGDFSACCLPTKNEKWRALELMKRFDELGRTNIFLQLYEKYVREAEFPSLQEAYRALGLTQTAAGVKFDANPEALHRTIMSAD
jgi:hypothetical protein